MLSKHRGMCLYGAIPLYSDNRIVVRDSCVLLLWPHIVVSLITTDLCLQKDSPVFNYINSLSPIKSSNSRHRLQSYQLLGCSSPQSSVASPPVSSPKEAETSSDSRVSALSKPETSNSGSEGNRDQVNPDARKVNHFESDGGTIFAAGDGFPKPAVELRPVFKHGSGGDGPESNCNATDQDYGFKRTGVEISPAEAIKDTSGNCLSHNDLELYQLQNGQNKETLGCDWEKLFSEAADLLICHSPTKEDHIKGPDASVSHPLHEHSRSVQDLNFVCPVTSSGGHNVQVISKADEKAEASCQSLSAQDCTIVAEQPLNDFVSEVHNKQHQEIRKRCLVFEVSGADYRKVISGSAGTSSISEKLVSSATSNEKQCVSGKPGSTKVSSLLPGIGLHLNALATSTRDKIIVKHDSLTRKRQIISRPSVMGPFGAISPNLKSLDRELALNPMVNESDKSDTDLQALENACQSSAIGESKELDHNSPRNKRHKSENVGDADDCKRCNCKRSKCLKLYCECFAAGLYCAEPCSCHECFNRPAFEETVIQTRTQIESRNPLAFAPKVITVSDSSECGDESTTTPASARHKRGCNCKKSNCLKRYCECFQGGVGCSLNCRCEGCKNSFGQKDGIEGPAPNAIEGLENGTADASLDMANDSKVVENQDLKDAPLSCRGPVSLPFRFGGLSSQVFPFSSGPSLQSCANQNLGKSSYLAKQRTSGTQLQVIPEDETPDFSNDDTSPTTNTKSISPKRRRISPPCRTYGSRAAWRTSRKLVLKSIPSFPTLTAPEENEELQGKPQ